MGTKRYKSGLPPDSIILPDSATYKQKIRAEGTDRGSCSVRRGAGAEMPGHVVVVAVAMSLLLATAGSVPVPAILTCSWSDLSSTDCTARALQLDGAVAITSVPGLASARAGALRQVATCLLERSSDVNERVLDDGTVRQTIGTRTLRGDAEPLRTACSLEEADHLRSIVDLAVRRFARSLEPLLRHDAQLPGGATSLTELVLGAEHLEHFHQYAPPTEAPPSSTSGGENATTGRPTAERTAERAAALALHTDAGLFVAIVPALHLRWTTGVLAPATDGGAADSFGTDVLATDGFYIERADGVKARLAAHASASSLLFVLGDGWHHWLNPHLTTALRAAPHALTMQAATMLEPVAGGAADSGARAVRTLRLWHGRMVLPPADAPMPSSFPQHDFDAWRDAHVSRALRATAGAVGGRLGEANDGGGAVLGVRSGLPALQASAREVALPVGCAGGGQLLQAAADCANGTIHCWMRCMPLTIGLPCGSVQQCIDLRTNASVAPDKMCPSCRPDCAPPPPPARPPRPHRGFCGDGTSMVMDMSMSGFFYGHATCLMLLYKGLPLDSLLRFRLGVLATLALGVLLEALICLRRGLMAMRGVRRRPRVSALLVTLLFAVQTALAYLLMLIVMTYQVELFLAAVGGLTLGHAALNLRAPVRESSDPCCADSGLQAPPLAQATTAAPLDGCCQSSALPLLAPPPAVVSERGLPPTALSDGPAQCVRVRVTGMTCTTCADRVHRALAAVEGVVSVRVSFEEEHAEVMGRSQLVASPTALIAAIQALGYSASPKQ